MANAYTIVTVQVNGDSVAVVGTVNGVTVTLQLWRSNAATNAAMASAVGWQNYIQPLMLAAYNALPQIQANSLQVSFNV